MNYVFYDTETTGQSKRFSQILQYAAVYTDGDFNEIDHLDLRCRLLPHVVPAPGAMVVTGVRPADLFSAPYSHYEMVSMIHDRLSAWAPATFIGQNTLDYDEELKRQAFWECLYQPYLTNTRGSIRVDILPILRAAHTVDPNVIVTAEGNNGNVSFKLDRIATLNGFQGHDAHDALGDVRATIHMARLIRERAPAVWNRMIANADPRLAGDLINGNPYCHYMTYFGKPEVFRVMRLTSAPSNQKKIATWNLGQDPEPYLGMTAEQLAEVMGQVPRPIQEIKLNAMPTLFHPDELGTPAPGDPVDHDLLKARIAQIQSAPGFIDRISEALELRNDFPEKKHIEEQIYSGGFPTSADKKRMEEFHRAATWAERLSIGRSFDDRKLKALTSRLVYFNAPEVMPLAVQDAMTRGIINSRLLATGEQPFMTIEQALKEADEMPDSEAVQEIRRWLHEYEQDARLKAKPLPVAAE